MHLIRRLVVEGRAPFVKHTKRHLYLLMSRLKTLSAVGDELSVGCVEQDTC